MELSRIFTVVLPANPTWPLRSSEPFPETMLFNIVTLVLPPPSTRPLSSPEPFPVIDSLNVGAGSSYSRPSIAGERIATQNIVVKENCRRVTGETRIAIGAQRVISNDHVVLNVSTGGAAAGTAVIPRRIIACQNVISADKRVTPKQRSYRCLCRH